MKVWRGSRRQVFKRSRRGGHVDLYELTDRGAYRSYLRLSIDKNVEVTWCIVIEYENRTYTNRTKSV